MAEICRSFPIFFFLSFWDSLSSEGHINTNEKSPDPNDYPRLSTMAPWYCISLNDRHSAGFHGLLLDWSQPHAVNPPWNLIPQVTNKMKASQASRNLCPTSSPGKRCAIPSLRAGLKGDRIRQCLQDGKWSKCRLSYGPDLCFKAALARHISVRMFGAAGKYSVINGYVHVLFML